MWVADNSDNKVYAYSMANRSRIPSRDFDPDTGDDELEPEGIWSDRTTMWVAGEPGIEDIIYAFRHANESRDLAKGFSTLESAGNGDPAGIWSDGTTMWVADNSDGKVYAYYMPISASDTIINEDSRNRSVVDPTDVTTETKPPDPSVINVEKCATEVMTEDGVDDAEAEIDVEVRDSSEVPAEEEVGNIGVGDTVMGKWEGGCPSITRGGRLAKYFTMTLAITSGVRIALDSHLDTYLVLRSGGLSGEIVAEDDDSGPGNNSLIDQTLTAGDYTIEATTFYTDGFYTDGVEADFTLSVRAVPRILYDGPVSDVAHPDYAPDGPTMTVKLLPTLPMGTLEITIEDPEGFGEGTGPLGGAQADGGSAGSAILVLPKSAWVQYDGITVETLESGAWSAHTQADEEIMLSRHSPSADLSPALLGLVRLIGKAKGALQLLESLAFLSSSQVSGNAAPGESVLDSVFRKSHSNCVSQVTVPWLVEASGTTGVRVSVPVTFADTDYLSLAASFVADRERPAFAQLHDLLDTGGTAPTCQPPATK